ncbi:MAG: porin [Planctomycetota bacterium]
MRDLGSAMLLRMNLHSRRTSNPSLSRRLFSLALSAALLLGLPQPAGAQSTDATSVEVAILDILLERGLIDQAQYQGLLTLAREKAAGTRGEIDLIEGRLERLRAADVITTGGTPGKLLFKSPDGKWSMGLKGRLQMRATVQKDDAPNLDANTGLPATDVDSESGTNFSVPRVRLSLEGQAGAENVAYKLEWDMSTTAALNGAAAQAGAKAFNMRNAYVDYGFQNGLTLRFGQAKFPFGREENTSAFGTGLMEKSLASNNFTPAYEPLMMLHGKQGEGEWEYYAAISNGDGQSVNNNDGDSENGLRKGVRVVWNLVGQPLKLDGPSFQTLDSGETRASIGASWMKNDNAVDKNTKGTLVAGAPSVRDSETLGLDFQLMSGRWSVLAEWFDRQEDRVGAAGQRDDGNTLQVGYFLEPHVWEVVARVSRLDGDAVNPAPGAAGLPPFSAGVLANTDTREMALGVNRYIDGHNSKWMFDVVRTDYRNHALVDDIDHTQYRVQYQVIF